MLAPGARLGPYEIMSLIGAGGMGEVWRARDTRLDREVAVKVLPSEFATNTQLKLRFEREARMVSRLNHPHICVLYDVGEAAPETSSGQNDASGVAQPVSYLVMEYLDGENLAERIAKGPLSLTDVLTFGAQVADALDRAHRAGVVHRDLKPGNVMITRSGAKLLDFGLAKSRATLEIDGPTIQKELTQEGTILGTFQYMAPEQIEGAEADSRTDIFALGAVLYEMASGKRAFEATTRTGLIAAIVKDDPRPISEIRPPMPTALDHVVSKCLEKDPDHRWQSAHDVGQELRWILETSSQSTGSVVRPLPRRRVWYWTAAAVVVLLAGTVAWSRTRITPEVTIERFELQPPDEVAIQESGAPAVLGISPDGRWIAFRGGSDDPAKRGLYVRSTSELEARRLLTTTTDGNNPFFSPDSKWIGFHAEGALQKVPLTGGEPQRIISAQRVRGASWGDDGSILFTEGNGLVLLAPDGGKTEAITTPTQGERHYWPHLLPGSKAALFTIHRGSGDAFRTVAVVSLLDRQIRELTPGTSPQYVDGLLFYSHFGNVYAARFDAKRLRLDGKPQVVLRDVSYYWGSGFADFAVARSGALAYVPMSPRPLDNQLIWLDRDGGEEAAIPERRPFTRIALSPDGRRIAVRIATAIEESDLWVYEIEGGRRTRLTYGKRVDSPLWSPDGQWIYFSSAETGQPDIWRVRADGTGAAEEVAATADWEYSCAITPDGTSMLLMRQIAPAQWDLLLRPLDGKGGEIPFLATETLEAWPTFSPDGRWVAYESDETGDRQIHVRPFPGPGPRTTVSTEGGISPFWSRDGHQIYYRKGDEFWAVALSTANGNLTPTAPRRHSANRSLLKEWNSRIAAEGENERLLAIRLAPEALKARRLVYVPNWLTEVESVRRGQE